MSEMREESLKRKRAPLEQLKKGASRFSLFVLFSVSRSALWFWLGDCIPHFCIFFQRRDRIGSESFSSPDTPPTKRVKKKMTKGKKEDRKDGKQSFFLDPVDDQGKNHSLFSTFLSVLCSLTHVLSLSFSYPISGCLRINDFQETTTRPPIFERFFIFVFLLFSHVTRTTEERM